MLEYILERYAQNLHIVYTEVITDMGCTTMAKEKFAIAMMDMFLPPVNIEFALDTDCTLKLVTSEEQAEKYIKLLNTHQPDRYQFYGLIPDPTKAFKALKKKVKK